MSEEIAHTAVMAALREQEVAAKRYALVGSTYISGTPGADVDLLVLVDRHPDELGFHGWVYGGSGSGYHEQWGSWKRQVGDVVVNMLLTSSETYYEAWCTAAEVCRLLHLTGVSSAKDLRIAIHNIIMDGADAEGQHAILTGRLL